MGEPQDAPTYESVAFFFATPERPLVPRSYVDHAHLLRRALHSHEGGDARVEICALAQQRKRKAELDV